MKDQTPPSAAGSHMAGSAIRRPTLSLDVALYESYLADQHLAEDQKRALLEALWSIIVGFVDLGFSVEPGHLADKAGPDGEEFANAGFALLNSEAIPTTDKFRKAAERATSAEAGMRE